MKRKYSNYTIVQQKVQICSQVNCSNEASFQAPTNSKLNQYRWFCKEHITAYNKSWNYFKNMNQEQIINHERNDMSWQRPTWSFSKNHGWEKIYKLFNNPKDDYRSRVIPAQIQKSLTHMELEFPFSNKILKDQYKTLIKKFHPDIHPNKLFAEEKLKNINLSYEVLKNYLYNNQV